MRRRTNRCHSEYRPLEPAAQNILEFPERRNRIDAVMEVVPTLDHDCFIYVIGGDGGTTKVGISQCPKERLLNIISNSGRSNLKIIYTENCKGLAREVEKTCLNLLRKQGHWVVGEWFGCPQEQIVAIIQDVAQIFLTIGEPLREDPIERKRLAGKRARAKMKLKRWSLPPI
jgi:hypothetical protein